MTEHDQLDRLLERKLKSAVSEILGDQQTTHALVDGALARARRRRRRVTIAASLGSSVAVVAAVLVAGQLSGRLQIATPYAGLPETVPTFTVHSSFPAHANPLAWASKLPRGKGLSEPYVLGHTLVIDGRHLDLGANTSVELEAALPGGWAVLHSDRVDALGNQLNRQFGFLSRGGQFRAFSFWPRLGSGLRIHGFAVSPDGTQVTYGGRIVDVATGAVVRQLPPNVWSIDAWTTAGIAYFARDHRKMLWVPRSAPQHTRWRFISSQIAIHPTRGCQAIGRMGGDQTVHQFGVMCGDAVGFVSSTGLTVTRTGRVVDVTTGHVYGHLPSTPPADGIFGNECCGINWLADNQFVVGITAVPVVDPDVQVSCDVSDEQLHCARVRGPAGAEYWPPPTGA